MKQQPIEGSLFHYDDTPQATPRKKPGRKPLVCEPEPRASLTKEEMREKLIGLKEIEVLQAYDTSACMSQRR